MIEPLVSSKWLSENLDDPDLIVLDASTSANKAGVDSAFRNQKIPGARPFNIKENFSKKDSPFPNTFPSLSQFEEECRKLGIDNSSKIVVYDDLGIYTSPRVWWMFKTMGHTQVYVLNGGLPDWVENNYETVEKYGSIVQKGDFKAHFHSSSVKDIDFVRSNLVTNSHCLIDVRSEERFMAKVPEPRAGLRSGNIPNSINIPYTEVLDNGKYKSKEELVGIFKKAQLDDRPITFSCGSGITACIVLLAAEMVLTNGVSVYDGSWTEYGTKMK